MGKFYFLPKAICVFNEFWSSPLMNWDGYKDVTYERKIRYSKNPDLYLNTCQRKDSGNEKKPLFFYIHGGGYVSGRPENREGCVSKFAEAGYFTASVFYGLSPKYVHPASLYNIYDALAFLIDNKERFNIDTDNIIVGGESAGAHFAALLGAISTGDELKKHYDKLNPVSRDLKFKGLYLNCGIFSMKDAAESKFPFMKSYLEVFYGGKCKELLSEENEKYLSPIEFLNESFPPSFVVTAEHDALRFGGIKFYEKLKSIGVKTEQYHAKGMMAIHAFAVGQKLKTSKEVTKNALAFFTQILGSK